MPNAYELLSPEKIQEYKQAGYTDEQIQQAVNELYAEAQQSQQSALQQSYTRAVNQQQGDARNFASNTLISGNNPNQNLVQWQLELDSILERVEHMLRGDKPRFVNGSMIFMPPTTNEERIFTDFGVAEVMRTLSIYLNRNTILSNYDDETINWKVYDFGNELADLIYLKYEVMFATMSMSECFQKVFRTDLNIVPVEKDGNIGADWWAIEITGENGLVAYKELTQEQMALVMKEYRTQKLEKRKLYPMIVRELVDSVHSAYLRALHGGERQSLHEARSVSQNETIMPGVQFNVNGQPVMKERSVLNPMRWVKGKYG